MNTTETKLDRITRAANGGGIQANQVLGCIYALPILRRKAEMVQGRVDRISAGRIPSNTDAEYAQIMIDQVATLVDIMRYNHPDAARITRDSLVFSFRSAGLAGLIAGIERIAAEAAETAALAN